MGTIVRACILMVCLVTSVTAQDIPNASFETWANGNPTNWLTSNIPSILENVFQTSNAHDGSSAVMGTVIATGFSTTPYTPTLISGTNGFGFPINFRPAALHGWYTFQSDSGDFVSAAISVQKEGTTIGVGLLYSATQYPVYSEFAIDVTYLSDETPDTALIFVLISNSPRVHVGSTFTLDDLSFGPSTDVAEGEAPAEFRLDQNYPNPFNPTTRIPFQLGNAAFVSLTVYDLLGREVVTLVNQELPPGSYRADFDASGYTAGVYFYRLRAGERVETRRMILLR